MRRARLFDALNGRFTPHTRAPLVRHDATTARDARAGERVKTRAMVSDARASAAAMPMRVVDDAVNDGGAASMALATMRAKLRAIDAGVNASRALRRLASDTRAAVREIDEMVASRAGQGSNASTSETTEARLTREAREALRPIERAREAIEALEKDERALFATWDALVELDLDSRAIRVALLRRAGQHERLDRGFDCVDDAWRTFEQMLWNTVRQSILGGNSSVAALVRCVRVVAEQEVLDAEYERDAADFVEEIDETTNRVLNLRPPEPKRWKTRVLEEMATAVEVRLSHITEGFSGLDDKESIENVLTALDESLVSLAEMHDYTIPAFPPEWRVFETVVAPTYHAGVCELLSRLSSSPNTSNGDMVTTVTWSFHYFTAIESLGLEIETTDEIDSGDDASIEETGMTWPPLPYPSGLSTLIDAYCERLRNTIAGWTENLSRVANAKPPKPDGVGKLWTPTDVEFFRLITDQMRIATGTRSNVFVRQCGRVAGNALYDFACTLAERLNMLSEMNPKLVTANSKPSLTPSRSRNGSSYSELNKEVSFERIVAGVNDARRCRDLSKDMQSMIAESMGASDDVVVRAIEQSIQKFNRIHTEARKMISRRVLDDPGLNDVLLKFYSSNSNSIWACGEAMTTLLATIEDYMGDLDAWLAVNVAESVTETLFEHLIELLFALFTKQLVVVAPHTVPRLRADETELIESMKLHMPENKALGRIARLQNLRELVSAASRDEFERAYAALLGNWPDAGLDVVDTILRARADFDKHTARATLDACRDVYISRVAELSGGRPTLGASASNHTRAPSESINARFKSLWSSRP